MRRKRDRSNKGRIIQETDADETGQEVGKNELLREEEKAGLVGAIFTPLAEEGRGQSLPWRKGQNEVSPPGWTGVSRSGKGAL